MMCISKGMSRWRVGIQSVEGALKAAKRVQMGGRAFDNTIEVRIDRLLTIPVGEPPVRWMDTQELAEMV
jgi:hypothetical protein